MRVHIALFGDRQLDAPARAFTKLAETGDLGHHSVAPDPQDADMIMFTQAHV